MTGGFARVALGQFAQRKERVRQLLLLKGEEEVALVLPQIATALQQVTSVLATLDAREMARGDLPRAQLPRAADERAELQPFVAHHARIGRAPGLVFLGEVTDDLLLKILRLVHEVIRDVQLVRNRARVGDRLRPAALVLRPRHTVLRPQFERDTDDLVALLQQQRGRSGGIHSPAHADDDTFFCYSCHGVEF
jgi:hypothetical protein